MLRKRKWRLTHDSEKRGNFRAALTIITMRAAASAPEAWNKHYAEVKAKCVAASSLLDCEGA